MIAADKLKNNRIALRHAKSCASLDDALASVAFSVACAASRRDLALPVVVTKDAAARAVEVARSRAAPVVFGDEKEEVNILRGIVKVLTQRKAGPRKSG